MAVARYRKKGPVYLPKASIGTQYTWDNIAKKWIWPSVVYFPSYENYKLSEKRECWDFTHPGPPYKEGGPLELKSMRFVSFPDNGGEFIKKPYRYSGSFVVNYPTLASVNLYNGYYKTAATWGATAWNRFRPVKPKAGLGQMLAEARDFLSLFKLGVQYFRDLGGAYLNSQFGWRPFLMDVLKWYKTMDEMQKSIDWIRKNNRKWIRRGGTVMESYSTGITNKLSSSLGYPVLPSYFYAGAKQGPTYETITIGDRIWFEARMKFFVDDDYYDLGDGKHFSTVFNSKLVRKLTGFELTPALLWELLPYSWLQDWLWNFGDIVANWTNSGFDNLVAKYAYIMRSRSVYGRYVYNDTILTDTGPVAVQATALTMVDYKERASASQWGFGQLSGEDLSARQWAILAALGLKSLPIL